MAVHRIDIQVRFNDSDTLGHINNAAYAAYAELGRLAFFRERVGDEVRVVGGSSGGLILANLTLDFRRQVNHEQSLHLTTEVDRIGRSSVTLWQLLYADGEVAAEIRSVVVLFDYVGQRPVPLGETVRAALERELRAPEEVRGGR